MSQHVIGKTFGLKECGRALALCICLVCAVALFVPSAAFCGSDKLIDSNEYKDKNGFHPGIITDYSDMEKGRKVDWVWVAPSQKLGSYKVKLGTVSNKSDSRSKTMVDNVRSIFGSMMADLSGSGAGTLTADVCITEVQQYAPGKAWIPYAGGHQMQAGIGIEMVLRDQSNRIIAKLRHFDRRGADVKDAIDEVADHMISYIAKN